MNKGMEALFLENTPVDLLSAAALAAGLVALVMLVKWLVINRVTVFARHTRNMMEPPKTADRMREPRASH